MQHHDTRTLRAISRAYARATLSNLLTTFTQHLLHDPNLGALPAVDIRCEIEQLSVLPGARSVEQVFYHSQGAAVVLNHPRQKQPVELRALCFLERRHLLRRQHSGHKHRMPEHIHARHVSHRQRKWRSSSIEPPLHKLYFFRLRMADTRAEQAEFLVLSA